MVRSRCAHTTQRVLHGTHAHTVRYRGGMTDGPHIQHQPPAYQQLVEHYRSLITTGTLAKGQRLPTVRDIAKTEGVSFSTAAKAIRILRDDGLVTSSRQGTVVDSPRTHTTRDRLKTLRHTNRIYPPDEHAVILSAQLTPAPEDVAIALLIPPGDPVVRRERITLIGAATEPTHYSVSWLPGQLATEVPELLVAERIPAGTIGAIQDRTGRTVARGTYQAHARRATTTDAQRLPAVYEGDPVIEQHNTWWENDETILEWGETVYAEGHSIEWEQTHS